MPSFPGHPVLCVDLIFLLYHQGLLFSTLWRKFSRLFADLFRQRAAAVLHRAPLGQGEALHGAEDPGLEPGVAALELVDQLLDLDRKSVV